MNKCKTKLPTNVSMTCAGFRKIREVTWLTVCVAELETHILSAVRSGIVISLAGNLISYASSSLE